jgi:branched-chain amino acid transport system ATP-binding protein
LVAEPSPPTPDSRLPTPILALNNLEVVYDRVILVLRGLSLAVPTGQIVALLGANGAGKSTTLKAISGLLRDERGEIVSGSVELAGQRIDRLEPSEVTRLGIFQVMEGRQVFQHLTVRENLIAGGYTAPGGGAARFDLVYGYFPELKRREGTRAGYLSGGQQQMLVIGRALMARPRLMLLDEPSLGLSPMLQREIFEIIQRINREEGTTILLVEQNANITLRIAHYGYVMESGRIVLEGSPERLRQNADVKQFYLGLTELGARRGYREVKHYKRRKRWL